MALTVEQKAQIVKDFPLFSFDEKLRAKLHLHLKRAFP